MNNEDYELGGGNIADTAHQLARQAARTRVVGQKERRVDARPLVTGAPVYAAEFEQPNMLHARILHSPHAHANILHIDTSKANTLPGVRAVLTHEDLPRVAHSTAGQPYPESSPYDAYLLDRRVRYVGDWVAFVAADTPTIAEEALSLIGVEYEVLPAVFDPLEAVLEPVAAALALKTRQPVRIEYSRQEEFTAGRFRHPMSIRMRSGVKRDGTLLALSMHSTGNAGAYGTHSFTVTRSTGHKTLCLYRAKAYAFRADAAYTNLPITGAMRGYGAPQGFFALESHIDEIAHRLNMDPLEFRRKNHVQKGDWDPMEMVEENGVWRSKRQFRSCGLPQCLERGSAAFGWGKPFDRGDGKPFRRGRGMATAMQGSGVASFELGGASIKLNEDGSFNVMTGATDIGQGSDTILAQIAAEALGVEMGKIIMHSVDTDSSVFDYGSYASSTTYISGGGVKVAAERVRQQILDVAGDMLDCAPEDMSIIDGLIYTPRGPSHLTVEAIANETLYGKHRQQIMAKGDFWTDDSPAPFFAQFVEVEVDTETGQVRVTRAVNVLDLGKAINPRLATGQVEGAVAMALGYALSEEVKFDEQGRVRNVGFADYKVMSTLDMPEMTTILIEDTEYSGPFGAKSAGEVPTNGIAPAVANAIQDALGVCIRSLPITPEEILQALDELSLFV